MMDRQCRTRNKAAEASLTATRPTARFGSKWVRWTRRMKAEFLDTLASTCNVRQAAAAIGVDPSSVYALRRRDAEFIREWEIALEAGYQMLETLMVGHVIAGRGRGDAVDMPEPPGSIDFEAALRVLVQYRSRNEMRPRRSGPRPQTATADETNAAILKKLAAIEKRRARA